MAPITAALGAFRFRTLIQYAIFAQLFEQHLLSAEAIAKQSGGTMTGKFKYCLLLCASAAMASCAHLPKNFTEGCDQAPTPDIEISQDGTTASTTLDVLTYNIEGLSWPARTGRAPYLREIGDRLKASREDQQGPDIVAFQEMFSKAAVAGVLRSEYPAMIFGPSRTQRGGEKSPESLPGRPKPLKGELGVHFFSGGLAIASRYPIVYSNSEPFHRRNCAGFDCLSNKGMLTATIHLPGVPEPVQLFNTHMNSQGSSRVSKERQTASHNAEAEELGRFFARERASGYPAIFVGDFNMRHSSARFDVFDTKLPLELVHLFCSVSANGCDVRQSWDGDAPWLDTQDLQLFGSGNKVTVTPILVQAMFDGSPDSPVLSDHDGFRVKYRLSWPRSASPVANCPSG